MLVMRKPRGQRNQPRDAPCPAKIKDTAIPSRTKACTRRSLRNFAILIALVAPPSTCPSAKRLLVAGLVLLPEGGNVGAILTHGVQPPDGPTTPTAVAHAISFWALG